MPRSHLSTNPSESPTKSNQTPNPISDPIPDPEPASPSLDEPDPGVFHHTPTRPPPQSKITQEIPEPKVVPKITRR